MKSLKIMEDFNEVKQLVLRIANTEKTYMLHKDAERGFALNDFSEAGLVSAGIKFNFPTRFIQSFKTRHYDTCNQILHDAVGDYFESHDEVMFREFLGKIYGVLSNRYAIFDDKEVCNLLKTSPYLMDAGEIWGSVSPEHLHLRFISKEKLYVDGDDSPLSMCVFVDNSMIGLSSLKIRFGIYRHACTNGVIWGLKEFNILKERHLGEKDFTDSLEDALKKAPRYEKMILAKVQEMVNAKSAIYSMTDEDAVRYLKDKLVIGKKTAGKIIELYESYGGKTKWDLCNAITDYAHNFDLAERVKFETKALMVA